jgi:hypothetical protein
LLHCDDTIEIEFLTIRGDQNDFQSGIAMLRISMCCGWFVVMVVVISWMVWECGMDKMEVWIGWEEGIALVTPMVEVKQCNEKGIA